jgi:hypothetical protein
MILRSISVSTYHQINTRLNPDIGRDLTTFPPDRRGTNTSTAYQRKGFVSWLTEHCKAIADAEGAAKYVGVRAASRIMFETVGFKIVGVTEKFDLKLYGGETLYETAILRREAQEVANMERVMGFRETFL